MRSRVRGLQFGASAVALALLAGVALSCGSEQAASTVGPPVTRAEWPAGTGTLLVEELEVVAPDTSVEEEDDTTVTTEDESTTTTEAPTSTTEPETTMAPSTSTTKPRTPVTISNKQAPINVVIPSYTMTPDERDFFDCVVFRESSGNPGVINASSGAAGLFQFLPSTWDATARHIGRGDLIGVNPALAPVALQWYMAHVLFVWQGPSPWASDGCVLHHTTTTKPPTTTTTRPPRTTTTPSF